MNKRYFLFSFDGGTWREIQESEVDELSGGYGSIVTIKTSPYHQIIEIDQYYFGGGELSLAISQPLERALATYGALLKADHELEVRDVTFNKS